MTVVILPPVESNPATSKLSSIGYRSIYAVTALFGQKNGKPFGNKQSLLPEYKLKLVPILNA